MFITVREENVEPLSVELLSSLAHREGDDVFPYDLEHGNSVEEICNIRPEVIA